MLMCKILFPRLEEIGIMATFLIPTALLEPNTAGCVTNVLLILIITVCGSTHVLEERIIGESNDNTVALNSSDRCSCSWFLSCRLLYLVLWQW